MSRTDIHRPSAIQPEDYEFVGFECVKFDGMGSCDYLLGQREAIRTHMTRTGGTYSHHEHGGNCGVCGNAFAVYTVLFHHMPSNTYVRFGQDCAAKCEMSYGDFNAFTEAIKDFRQAVAGKRKAQAVLADAGLEPAWTIYAGDIYAGDRESTDGMPFEECTIIDIVGKLVKYGSVSERQTSFLRSLLDKITNRATLQAQRDAERATAADCPNGRVEISGIIIKTKSVPSSFRYAANTIKMVVKDDRGFLVYVTAPDSILGTELRGRRISLTATVTPSSTDLKFGFGKRPAKAQLLNEVQN